MSQNILINNLLISKLPTSVVIDGAEVKINTDFRICLKIILAFEDEELTNSEKCYILLHNLYGDSIPTNTNEAINQGIIFLNCGEICDNTPENSPRLYSFEKDSRYIYSALKLDLNVNLDNGLHWWDFVNYFMVINEKSFFARMIYLRAQKAKGKLTKEELQYWNEHKDILDLNDNEQEDEEVIKFKNLMKGG